ncbi:kunitz-type protease inhibitor 1 [Hemicordylus capensis]|uniref:kunitz-type protease inhibitor 1 n=1 Tax=Hemicordylus capensis TaxID=884348 RepID=UPI002303A559|nr:kunitz-type protease inhibitor 1 [Hemicordylus capensis]
MARSRHHLQVGLLMPLVLAVLVLGQEAGPEEPSFGEACLSHFTRGLPEFVLDPDASVQNGATFLGSPPLERGKDCVRACCKNPHCNLALVEQAPGEGEDSIQSCFLLDCLYDQRFVCKFARKDGFLNYVKKDVYDAYSRHGNRPPGDRPPIARAWVDMKVQPGEAVTLRGTESSDDHGIVNYEWTLLQGDSSVEMKKEEDRVVLTNLQEGVYVFQLTVTDAAEQQDSTTITVTVLNAEQTAEHCLAPSKVGRCRGSFPRWYYNPASQQCQRFIFGGCNSNKNNYLREEECNLACQNVQGAVETPQEPVCSGNCLPFNFKCEDGCCIDNFLECDETLDCKDGSDEKLCDSYIQGFNKLRNINASFSQGHCVEKPDTARCDESLIRWYYNPFTEQCDRFTYGGCEGNKNNFQDEEECMKSCKGITKADLIGLRWRGAEAQRAHLSSFETAIAVLLVVCILIVLAILGYFFLKNKKTYRRRRQPPTAANSTLSSVLSTTEDTEHLVYNSTTKPI